MFYLPELFTNVNSVDLGSTQLTGKLCKFVSFCMHKGMELNSSNVELYCRLCAIASLG
mgnify:CR=1 FL=1